MSATWWTKPDGQRVLVLDVHIVEEGLNEHECAAIPMTVELAQQLLARIERVRGWQAQDGDLMCAQFWNYSPEYFGRDYDAEHVDADGNAEPQWQKGDWDGRTDTDRLEVGSDWVEWRAYVKNTDIRLHTDSLDEQTLRQYAAGDDPWPSAPVDDEAKLHADVEKKVETFSQSFKAPEPVPTVLKQETE